MTIFNTSSTTMLRQYIAVISTITTLLIALTAFPVFAQEKQPADVHINDPVNVDSNFTALVLPVIEKNYYVDFIDSDINSQLNKNIHLKGTVVPILCVNDAAIRKSLLRCALYIGDDFNYGLNDFSAEVEVTITGQSLTTRVCTLKVHTSSTINEFEPEAHHLFDITGEYSNLSTLNVTAKYLIPPTWPTTIPTMKDALKLRVSIVEDFDWNVVNKTNSLTPIIELQEISSPSTDSRVEFSWQFAEGCVDSIPNYQFQLLRLYNVDPAKTTSPYTITASIDWSQALTIETGKEQSIKLTVAEGTGYYAWRVRPIGSKYEGGVADDRNWGVWTAAPSGNSYQIADINKTNVAASEKPSIFFYEQFDDDKNWIYSRVFSEGEEYSTKIGEKIEYAGYLLQTIQSQARIASNVNGGYHLLVSQTALDYSGRPAVQSLGTPVTQDGFGYIERLMRNSSTNPAEDLYRAADFDEATTYNNPNPVRLGTTYTEPFDYYSNLNPDIRVPNADQYPFKRVIYSKDGANRPREEGGAGAVHRIGGSAEGSTRTVRTLYGTASDQELIWLFGDEAPDARAVRKVISIDPNNVASISYVNKDGQTLATALSAQSNDRLFSLTTTPSAAQEHTFPSAQIIQEITKNDQRTEDGFIAGYRLTLDVPTQVTLNYQITPKTVSGACGQFCASCDYIIDFYVHDVEHMFEENPNPNDVSTPINYTNPSFPIHQQLVVSGQEIAAAACDNPQSQRNWAIPPISLQAGTYRIERRIRVANINPLIQTINSPIGTTYIAQHLAEVRSKIEDALGLPVNPPSVPPGPLQVLFPMLELGAEDDPEEKLSDLYTYLDATYPLVDNEYVVTVPCCTLRIPKIICSDNTCSNGTPDFEAYFISKWGKSNYTYTRKDETTETFPSDDIRDFFFRRGTELYPQSNPAPSPAPAYTNGNGAFNKLVANMITAGYSCSELWKIWVGIVNSWGTLATKDGSGDPVQLNKDYDLLDHFLLSAGKQYVGISNCPYGDCNATPTTEEGYLDNAWKYFQYDGTSSPECNAMVGYPGWTTPKWDDLYNCITNINRTSPLDDDIVPANCADPESVECAEAYRDSIVKACRSVCADRYDAFVLQVIETYHAAGKTVQGDKYDTDGTTPLPEDEFDVSMKEVYCTADALVAHCESECSITLTVNSANPPRVTQFGTDQERERFKKIFSYGFELSLPVNNSCTDNEAVLVQSQQGSTTGEQLVHFLNERLADLQKHSGILGDDHPELLCEELGDAYEWFMTPGDGNGEGSGGEFSTKGDDKQGVKLLTESGNGGACWPCDCEGTDTDSDGIPDECDNCPSTANPDQKDSDFDGKGDVCDNCDWAYNPDQQDSDNDGLGNACDNCPTTANSNQTDTDEDGIGDACDNCDNVPNVQQSDSDNDGVGNACDNCVAVANANQADSDNDNVGTACDNCPNTANTDQSDDDNDGLGDACDLCPSLAKVSTNDHDGDGINDASDLCPCVAQVSTNDHDGDGQNDNVDPYPCSTYSGTLINSGKPEVSMIPPVDQSTDTTDTMERTIANRSAIKSMVTPLSQLHPAVSTPALQQQTNSTNPFRQISARLHEKKGGARLQSEEEFNEDDNPYLEGAECPGKLPPMIFQQGSGIKGRFLLGNDCQLLYERICTRGGTTVIDTFLLCTDICDEVCDAKICFKWKEIVMPEPDFVFVPMTCERDALQRISRTINNQVANCITNAEQEFLSNYEQKCAVPENIDDNFTIQYSLNYYHFTLYYYDRAGNLVRTVPPKGVTTFGVDRKQHPARTFQTGYEYNSLKQIVRQTTPDGGVTTFYYDDKGRLRFSQSSRQYLMIPQRFSFTKYDNLNRIVETGEAIVNNGAPTPFTALANANDPSYPMFGRLDVVNTIYSTYSTSNEQYYLHEHLQTPPKLDRPQKFLRNRVSKTTTAERVTTYYSYDPHGNVEWLAQYIPGLGGNFIRYEYDLISNKVTKVLYDEGQKDQFSQRYSYDADQRLNMVETSRDGEIWDRDAQYDYAAHGVLERTRLGEDKIQSIDRAYTIQGWLKAVNHLNLVQTVSLGDNFNHNVYAKDVFAMTLGYYAGDFVRTSTSASPSSARWNSATANSWHLQGTSLYNGNISSWTSQHASPTGHTPYTINATGFKYRYDVLNRLMTTEFYERSGSSFTPKGTDFNESFTYDPNGNILTLVRNGHGATPQMDNFTYNYSNPSNNRLGSVTDAVGANTFAGDIEPPAPWLNLPPAPPQDHYRYDGSGNLIQDLEEGTRIRWNAYGKVVQVRKMMPTMPPGIPNATPDIREDIYFRYNAAGNRVAKYVLRYVEQPMPPGPPPPGYVPVIGTGTATFYVRDANEEVLAVYTKELHPPTNDYTCWPDYLQRQPGGGQNPLDMDGDGILNVPCDNCAGPNPGLQWSNPWQEDYDGDGIGNSCDPCPLSTGGTPCPASPEPPVPQPSIVDVWSSTIPAVTLAELHIYGSDRLGMYLPNEPRDTAQLVTVVSFVRTLRKREYELKDHLGNVRVTISDLKIGNGTPIYNADIRSYTNHYAFGMVQPDRSWVIGGGYRYGFNGKESDNEVSGNGNQYDYGFRIYNPRIARFLSEDPLTKDYPSWSPYPFAMNRPIDGIDLDGLEYLPFQKPMVEFVQGHLHVVRDRTHWLNYDLKQLEKKGIYSNQKNSIGFNLTIFDFNVKFEKSNKTQGSAAVNKVSPKQSERDLPALDPNPGAPDPLWNGLIIRKVGIKEDGTIDRRVKGIIHTSAPKSLAVGGRILLPVSAGIIVAEIGFSLSRAAEQQQINNQRSIAELAINDVSKAVKQGDIIPSEYLNVESLSHIANVVLTGINTSDDHRIYEIGISIIKKISKNYKESGMSIQNFHSKDGGNTWVVQNKNQ